MRRKLPIWLMGSVISIIGIILGCFTVYQQRNQVEFSQVTYFGDIKYCDGIEFDMFGKDSYFGQNLTVNFDNGLNGNAEFKSLYGNKEEYSSSEFNIITGYMDRIWKNFSPAGTGTYHYKIRDYYKIYPIQFNLLNEQYYMQTTNEVNDLLLVEVPEDASVTITSESYGNTSTLSMSQDYNSIYIDLPYIKTEEGCYFTIPNLVLENYIQNDEIERYQGISGILHFKTNGVVWLDKMDNVVTVCAPIEISSDLDVIVLDLVEASKAGDLALAVLENQELYLYYYDESTTSLLNKSLIGKLPTDAKIQNFKIMRQENYVLTNYSYIDEKGNIQYASGVYNYLDGEGRYDVLLSKDYTSELPENFPSIGTLAADLWYIEGRLYLTHYGSQNNVNLFALGHDKILYAGTIATSLHEDYSIGSLPGEAVQTDYNSRHISGISFRKSE